MRKRSKKKNSKIGFQFHKNNIQSDFSGLFYGITKGCFINLYYKY